MKELERTRWRCRRGMLELDIVLDRFVLRYYGQLDEPHRLSFDALLDMPDTTVWDMITGRAGAPEAGALSEVLELIRSA